MGPWHAHVSVDAPDAVEAEPTRNDDLIFLKLSEPIAGLGRRLRRFGFGQGEAEAELCDIPYGDRNIWGATAGMLVTLYRLCALGERP